MEESEIRCLSLIALIKLKKSTMKNRVIAKGKDFTVLNLNNWSNIKIFKERFRDQTGIVFSPAAIGIPKKPTKILKIHWTIVSGVVLANVPKNSMIMI